MAIFATMVSLRNWVGGEIVQARGKPRGTKTLRWVFLKERTMKPHHKLFFFLLFLPELVSFNTVFAVSTECFEFFFFVGPTNAGVYYRKQEGKPTNRNCVWGNDFRAGNMHFLISAVNFWGEIVLNSLTSEQAALLPKIQHSQHQRLLGFPDPHHFCKMCYSN